jgi:hypothetical protein
VYMKHNAPECLIHCGFGWEISHYHKYSDHFIEFEACGCKYRYIESATSSYTKYPLKRDEAHYCSHPKDIFEIYDYSARKYVPVDYIERIELIPEVDTYDKN